MKKAKIGRQWTRGISVILIAVVLFGLHSNSYGQDQNKTNKLGLMYLKGISGVKQNYKEAFNWLKKAAEQGDVSAQCELGFMYEQSRNDKEAFNFYKKAAEQGLAVAQCCLGLMYYNGAGVEQNYKEAFNWYKKAADQRCERAKYLPHDPHYSLGVMYEKGLGVKQNYKEALNWFKKAAGIDILKQKQR